jgi:hypothetical protein
VWTAPEEPLPVEERDAVRAVRAPGWIVSATRADGLVRVVNHGTDHADEGSGGGDSPLYARLGYSTATTPVLDGGGWLNPLDQSVTLVDEAGRATHRTGMRLIGVHVNQDGVGVAGSRALAHWVDPDTGGRNHGGGYAGRSQPAGHLTVYSLVRGPWEMRLARVDDVADGLDLAALRLVVGGWPVPDGDEIAVRRGEAAVTGAGLTSRVESVLGGGSAAVVPVPDGGPLGASLAVPRVEYTARVGVWTAVLVELSRGFVAADRHACQVVLDGDGSRVDVDWPDGARTTARLDMDLPGSASTATW